MVLTPLVYFTFLSLVFEHLLLNKLHKYSLPILLESKHNTGVFLFVFCCEQMEHNFRNQSNHFSHALFLYGTTCLIALFRGC